MISLWVEALYQFRTGEAQFGLLVIHYSERFVVKYDTFIARMAVEYGLDIGFGYEVLAVDLEVWSRRMCGSLYNTVEGIRTAKDVSFAEVIVCVTEGNPPRTVGESVIERQRDVRNQRDGYGKLRSACTPELAT